MLLAVDIGNTNIVIGLFKKDRLEAHWRLSTEKSKTADEYGTALLALFAASGIPKGAVKGAVAASVVPELDEAWKEAISRHFGVEPLFVDHANCGIRVATENPAEVGADRLVNAVEAYRAVRGPLIVVDFGTAVTFDYVNESGDYEGGIIAPGIGISAEALFSRTSKLPRVEPRRPGRLIGRNTADSMRSGIFYGFIGLVDGILERMLAEAATAPRVVATGGLAPLVAGESRFVTGYDEFLTLKGLKTIYEGNR